MVRLCGDNPLEDSRLTLHDRQYLLDRAEIKDRRGH
jgi:hypothetical protein